MMREQNEALRLEKEELKAELAYVQARMRKLETLDRTGARTPGGEGSRVLRVESPRMVDQRTSVETSSEFGVHSAHTSAFEPPLPHEPTTASGSFRRPIPRPPSAAGRVQIRSPHMTYSIAACSPCEV